MPFMSAPASGDFNTFIKYDARAGRWYSKPDGGGEQFEVTNMTAVMDLPNISTGWFRFFEGAAPVKVFDPSLFEEAPKPDPEAKRGFEVMMFSEKNFGGLREFASTAGCVIDAMNELYDAWKAAPESKTDKLPVIKCVAVAPVKSAKSTNYRPDFKIVSWVDRPAAFAGTKAAEPAKTPPPAAKAPEPATAGAAADSDGTDF